MLNTVISIISLILGFAQSGGFWFANSKLPEYVDWTELNAIFAIVPIVISSLSVLGLYLPLEHRYDDFIKDDSKYKKWFWLSFLVSVMLSLLLFCIYNNVNILAIVICLGISILGATTWFISIANIVRSFIPSLKHYPLSFRPF
jgi:hypothetical protein